MIKVLIADDELLVRIGIKSTIPWEENGLTVVGEASNGEEALSLFKEFRPEIVITDIKMPRLDGIALTERIKEISAQTRIILLTCYSEFNYVQDAIKLGASDYIIKSTMEPAELLQSVLKLKAEIEKEQESRSELERVKRELQLQKPMIKQKAISDFIRGHAAEPEELARILRDCGLEASDSHFIILYVVLDDFRRYDGSATEKRSTLKKAVVHTAAEVADAYNNTVVDLDEQDFACLIAMNGSHIHALQEGKRLAKKIQSAVSQYTENTVSVAISRYINTIADIPHAFQETREFMNYRVMFGKNCVITPNEIGKIEGEKYENQFKFDQEELLDSLHEGNAEKVRSILNQIFDKIAASSGPLSALEHACIHLVSLLNKLADDYRYDRDARGEKAYFSIREVFAIETIDGIKQYIGKQFELLCRHIYESKYRCAGAAVRKALDYVGDHYAEQVTLADVAERVHVSRTYFSQIFKQETGENFVDYLNGLRVAKAGKMLADTECKTQEIAEKTGFCDNSYFCRVFKQLTGLTPTEYRKKRMF